MEYEAMVAARQMAAKEIAETHERLFAKASPEPYVEELERLEGRPVVECCWRARMWRKSYCVSLYAIKVLEQRVIRLRSASWDTPMTFFYEKDQP